MTSQKKYKFKSLISFLKKNYISLCILLVFFVAYLLLSVIKHISFLSGYDLSVIDQAIWKYSQFKNPITTSHVYYDTPVYVDHLELIFVLISPIYWVINDVIVLVVLQVVAVISSGIAVLLLAKKYKLSNIVCNAILVSYLSFFGLQFAVWSDVHSLVFGVAFLSWFLYFLHCQKTKITLLFLLLAIISKEDIALLSCILSAIYFIKTTRKLAIACIAISSAYLFSVFFLYFPAVLPEGYRFASDGKVLSNLNPLYLIDSTDKQKTILYSLGWFGFIPLLAPLYVVPFFTDLAHYFVLGKGVVRTEDIFLHYRSSVGLLLVWPTIIVFSKFKKMDSWPIALYLLISALFFQYYLHLPLSYLTKKWFWNIPPEATSINNVLKKIPSNASVVTQINIGVHISHRDNIFTLFPSLQDFSKNSPCKVKTCKWFRVGGNPQYLLYDKGESWNALHYLGSRDDFFEGITNLEKNGNITLVERYKTTYLYKIVKKI